MNDCKYFVLHQDQQHGPFDLHTLRDRYARRVFSDRDLVARLGDGKWTPISAFVQDVKVRDEATEPAAAEQKLHTDGRKEENGAGFRGAAKFCYLVAAICPVLAVILALNDAQQACGQVLGFAAFMLLVALLCSLIGAVYLCAARLAKDSPHD